MKKKNTKTKTKTNKKQSPRVKKGASNWLVNVTKNTSIILFGFTAILIVLFSSGIFSSIGNHDKFKKGNFDIYEPNDSNSQRYYTLFNFDHVSVRLIGNYCNKQKSWLKKENKFCSKCLFQYLVHEVSIDIGNKAYYMPYVVKKFIEDGTIYVDRKSNKVFLRKKLGEDRELQKGDYLFFETPNSPEDVESFLSSVYTPKGGVSGYTPHPTMGNFVMVRKKTKIVAQKQERLDPRKTSYEDHTSKVITVTENGKHYLKTNATKKSEVKNGDYIIFRQPCNSFVSLLYHFATKDSSYNTYPMSEENFKSKYKVVKTSKEVGLWEYWLYYSSYK